MRVIADPVQARRLIDAFLTRAAQRDAYGELLASGQVSRQLSDADARDAWRRDLRRQARADKLKIITREYDDFVIALLNRPPSENRDDAGGATLQSAFEASHVAAGLGHRSLVLAREHEEAIAHCEACRALGYVNVVDRELVLAGTLYTDSCAE